MNIHLDEYAVAEAIVNAARRYAILEQKLRDQHTALTEIGLAFVLVDEGDGLQLLVDITNHDRAAKWYKAREAGPELPGRRLEAP